MKTTIKDLKRLVDERFVVIPLSKLKPAPWNFKKDDEENARKLIENIRRNGQIKNCNVRELGDGTYEIIDGNHRLPAYRALGFEGAICYNHGPISQASAIRLAHEVVEYFEIDTLKQSDALELLTKEVDLSDLAETSVFKLGQLENIMALSDFDWESLERPEEETEERFTISFTLPSEEALMSVQAEIDRLIKLYNLPQGEVGQGRALEKMTLRSMQADFLPDALNGKNSTKEEK